MVEFAVDQYIIGLKRKIEHKTGNIMDVKDKIVSVIYPYITLTDFEDNTIREPANDGEGET